MKIWDSVYTSEYHTWAFTGGGGGNLGKWSSHLPAAQEVSSSNPAVYLQFFGKMILHTNAAYNSTEKDEVVFMSFSIFIAYLLLALLGEGSTLGNYCSMVYISL